MPNPDLEPGQILDVHAAARLLGYHEETLRRMTREGRVPAFRIGRKWHYDRQVLARWTAEQHAVQQRRFEGEDTPAPRVLVVDDEDTVCEIFARFLSKAGFSVSSAQGGPTALEALQTFLPDLLVVDLVMPEVDGVAVMAFARERAPELPIIVCTGHPDGDAMTRAMAHSPFTLLAKPVTQDQLIATARLLTGQGVRAQ